MYRSVSVLVLFVILTSAMDQTQRGEYMATMHKCSEINGMNLGYVGQLLEDSIRDSRWVDGRLDCFMACTIKELHRYGSMLEEHGSLDFNMAGCEVPADQPKGPIRIRDFALLSSQ